MIEAVYHHCTKWEDWKNGMFRSVSRAGDDDFVTQSAGLLSNPDALYKAMSRVIIDWPICTEENLTKIDKNRRAWLGWAACSINHKAPDMLTRKAWFLLTDKQRVMANLIADKVIFEWESQYKKGERFCQLSLWA